MELVISVQMKVNTEDPEGTQEVLGALARLFRDDPKPELAAVIAAVANAKYGNRLEYLAVVAAAGDEGVAVDTLRDHFDDHHSFGGTHAAIEKTWRAQGGQAFAENLITDTPDKRQVMLPAARPLILNRVKVD